tara:strand:- start:232 stop:648 length:417 start_codon:yes stop_codon:yes gene_type:complete
MSTALILIIIITTIEIYLFIEIGSRLGAFMTIFLIFFTALLGIWYARYEGLNTLKSGISQIIKNELPLYELLSGAALAIGAILLMIPGFLTDLFGLLVIIPYSRKLIFKLFSNKFERNKNQTHGYIDGESEEIDENKK